MKQKPNRCSAAQCRRSDLRLGQGLGSGNQTAGWKGANRLSDEIEEGTSLEWHRLLGTDELAEGRVTTVAVGRRTFAVSHHDCLLSTSDAAYE